LREIYKEKFQVLVENTVGEDETKVENYLIGQKMLAGYSVHPSTYFDQFKAVHLWE